MNGRVYDPLLGRMLSPDAFVQNPSGTQAFNRYSYVMNNPLKYSDPTGYLYSASFYAPQQPNTQIFPYAGFQFDGNHYIWKHHDGSDGFGTWSDYHSDGAGGYSNGYGDPVDFSEVYNNYLAPYSSVIGSKLVKTEQKVTYYLGQATRVGKESLRKDDNGEVPVYVTYTVDVLSWVFYWGDNGVDNISNKNESNLEGFINNWFNNSDPFAKLELTTRTGAGAGGKISIIGIQFGLSGNFYSKKRSGTISTGGLTSQSTKISNFAVNCGILGLEYERNWSGKTNIGSFDVGPYHFESGNYPTFRIFSVSGQFIGGGSVDVDLNLGILLNSYSTAVLDYYNFSGSVPLLYH